MSRTLASVIALTLALPVIAFVAAGAAAGISPSIYSGAIGFVVGVCFIGGALLEVHRLATARPEDLLYGWMTKPTSSPVHLVQPHSSSEIDHTRVEVLREPKTGLSHPDLIGRAAA